MVDESRPYRILRCRPGPGRDSMLVVCSRASTHGSGPSNPVNSERTTKRSKSQQKVVNSRPRATVAPKLSRDQTDKKGKGKEKVKVQSPDQSPDEVNDFLLDSIQPGLAKFSMMGIQRWASSLGLRLPYSLCWNWLLLS
ncbi:hypothetical protein VNI00_017040 [Paramarasmius palmivorus]|uniref:Uncharacterized protein n=1 Tax=Paramarasmius palmivorus TaxID=297713 RepID=A0AAW0B875_9AGAR